MPRQLSRSDVEEMSSDAITDALHSGQLSDLLAGREPDADLTVDQLAALSDDELDRLRAELRAETETQHGDADQGARRSTNLSQITERTVLENMTPEQINEARLSGRLDSLMGRH